MTGKWPDLAGRIEGETHILPIRVYFEDTDCGGVVYHANFAKFCERGRSDFIRLLGVSHQGLANPEQGEPAIFVVRRIEMDYLRPARMDDVLEVVTRCSEVGNASLVLTQEVRRDPEVIFASWCGKKVKTDKIRSRPGWDRVSAVRDDRIYEIKSTYILQPGPASLTAGVRQLHEVLRKGTPEPPRQE